MLNTPKWLAMHSSTAVVLPAVAVHSTKATTSHHRQQQTSKSFSQIVIASQ